MQGAFVRSTTLQFWHGAGTTGGTIKVVLIDSQGRFADWVSESFGTLAEVLANDVTNLVSSGFAAGMTEQQDGDMNPTGVYVKSTSAISFITPGSYTAIALDSVSIASDRCIQPMYWDGTYWTPTAGQPVVETRDLREASKANQWEMVQRAGGVVSLNPVTIYQGETKTVGFDCSRIMSASDVMATMGTPTASDGDLTPTKIGIGPKWANLTLAAAADTTAGTGYTVRVTVTTDEGDGPILLIGNVTVGG